MFTISKFSGAHVCVDVCGGVGGRGGGGLGLVGDCLVTSDECGGNFLLPIHVLTATSELCDPSFLPGKTKA